MDTKVQTTGCFRHDIKVAAVDLFPLRAKGGVSPKMALGSMPTRPALLVRLADTDGCTGWGEIWANFPPRANLHKAQLVDDVVTPKLRNLSFVEPREITDRLRDELEVYFLHVGQSRVFDHILAGLDMALWDLALRQSGKSFAEHMGLSETRAPTYASSINIPDLERLIPEHANLGQQHFKLKIGFMEDDDRRFIEKANQIIPANSQLMIDSNQSWNLEQAKDALQKLEPLSPLFAEEPMRADAPKLVWEALAQSTSIPLAGGENIYGVENYRRMAEAGMQFLQPDVAKWGGVTGALQLANELPENTNLWPHFMGTAVGQQAALCVTAAIGGASVCEMDVNINPLRTKLCGDVLTIRDGSVTLPRGPGLVTPPTNEALMEFQDRGS